MGGPWNGQSEVQIDYGRKGADLNWTWMKRRFDSLLSDVRFICHLCVKRKDFGLFYLRNCIFFFSQYVQKETRLWRFIQRHLLQPSPKSLFYILLEERASDQCSCQTRAASLYLQTAVQSNLFSLKRDSSLSPRITFFSTDTTFLVQIFVVTGGGILVTLVYLLTFATAPPWIWRIWFWFRDYNWMDCHDICSRLSRPPQDGS